LAIEKSALATGPHQSQTISNLTKRTNFQIWSKKSKFQNPNVLMPKTVLSINRLLKKSFFSQTHPWTNKSKILSAGLPGADRSVFEK